VHVLLRRSWKLALVSGFWGLFFLGASARKTSILPFPVIGRCRSRPGQFLRAGRGRKPHICRWICHLICHSARDVSISGFGGHIAISGCRSLSQSLGDTLFGLGARHGENPGLAVRISTLSVVVLEV